MTAPRAAELTIDRLFDAPALAGPTLQGLRVAPDGSRVTYLQGKATDKNRLDLWEYDVAQARSRLLVDSNDWASAALPLSDEEIGRRERQRKAALSGILEYSFAASGRTLLFAIDGALYVFDFTKAVADAVAPIGLARGFASDARLSPRGGCVAFVREQNLFVRDLADGGETALTTDGGGVIKNGLAEFVAQEEMDRSTGYWWSPDGLHIAFARIDESPITPTQRFEIAADNVASFTQRYAAAGAANALVQLGVASIRGGPVTWIELGDDADIYLARVNWLPDGRTLAIQRESRDQRRLDLLFADSATGASRVILTEASDSWIELNDEICFLEQSREFLWVSSRDGFPHVYLYDWQGQLLRRVTAGRWSVDDFRQRAIKAVDAARRLVYFSANARDPTARDLYVASLDTGDPCAVRRISLDRGVHAVTMAPGAEFYVDQFTSRTQPPQGSLR